MEYYGVGGSGPDPNTSWWRSSWRGRQHKLVGTDEIIVSSPMQPKPPDGIRMCVLLLRVHLVRLYYYTMLWWSWYELVMMGAAVGGCR